MVAALARGPGRASLTLAGAALVLGLAVAAMAMVWLMPPIPQDPAYHRFAEQRTLLGVPHFRDTLSNLAFLVIGGLGAWQVMRGPPAGGLRELRMGYLVFFLGLALIEALARAVEIGAVRECLDRDDQPVAAR